MLIPLISALCNLVKKDQEVKIGLLNLLPP